MSRWQPDARGRLQLAALALYHERGFEQTTVAQIAARAGLTERTFFRYFTDKREVLFWGSGVLQDHLTSQVAGAPADLGPLAALSLAFEVAAVEVFEERREGARHRQAVIVANPVLRERELTKLAALAAALAETLRARGVPDPAAGLAAEAGVAVFKVAFEAWVGDPGPDDLAALIRASFDELRALS